MKKNLKEESVIGNISSGVSENKVVNETNRIFNDEDKSCFEYEVEKDKLMDFAVMKNDDNNKDEELSLFINKYKLILKDLDVCSNFTFNSLKIIFNMKMKYGNNVWTARKAFMSVFSSKYRPTFELWKDFLYYLKQNQIITIEYSKKQIESLKCRFLEN